jgi:hypothetical protein
VATQASKPRAWPTIAKRALTASLERLERAAAHLDNGIESVEYQRSPDVSNAHLYQVARLIADVRRLLTEASNGTPDDLQVALDLLREMRQGMTPEANRQADELLTKYD